MKHKISNKGLTVFFHTIEKLGKLFIQKTLIVVFVVLCISALTSSVLLKNGLPMLNLNIKTTPKTLILVKPAMFFLRR